MNTELLNPYSIENIELDLLPIEDVGVLKKIEADVMVGFERQQMFRSRYLMEVSVLNEMKHPTADSKYAQSNLERDVHFRNLVMLSYDFREKQADIKILEWEIKALDSSDPHILKKEIQIEREQASLHFMKKEAHERVREITNWTEIMEILKPQLNYDPDDPEQHLPEKFMIRYQREEDMMKKAGAMNAQDMNGAMNILSLKETVKCRSIE